MPVSIEEAVAAIRARHGKELDAATLGARTLANRLGARAPYVHRTGKPGGPPWGRIFDEQVITAQLPSTSCERDLGHTATVYLFLASGAYAQGNIAFVMAREAVLDQAGTATPFDSGGCFCNAPVLLERASTPFPSQAARCAHIRAHMLERSQDVGDFTACYVLAHFHDPSSYIRLPQIASTDRPVFHDLRSPTNDRRAWTIELQRHANLPVPPDRGRVLRVIIADRSLFSRLPPAYRRLAEIAEPRTTMEAAIAAFCEEVI